MKLGRPQAVLVLTQEQRAQLESLASSRSLPHGLVIRVRIILLSAQGLTNRSIAVRLRWSEATVGKWRRRFIAHGISGLHDEWRPGRPRSISDERATWQLCCSARAEGCARGLAPEYHSTAPRSIELCSTCVGNIP